MNARSERGKFAVRLTLVILLVCWSAPAAAQTVEETILDAFTHVSAAELELDARVLVGLEPFDEQYIASRAVGSDTHDLALDQVFGRAPRSDGL